MWHQRSRSLAGTLSRLRARRLRDFAQDQGGNALLEAALVFPILVGLFLGVSEFSEAFTASRRLDAAAYTAADLVARSQSVTAADLNGVKAMVDETVKPFPLATLGLIITSVVADNTNATTVAWSTALGTGVSAYGIGAAISLPAGLTLPKGSIVFAEVKYQFKSTLSTLLVGSVPLKAQAYQVPRYSTQVVQK
ncbi:MAG TPA: TadE/TadG family type IV pilus assembly protein [Hyphomicrobiaceae bacterium]|jgi:Flp pilus assembly protein TadG|nr:TadE/TadG family type IV pilus assembly protein [Hyphomicrobiaceae bacterium]